MKKGEVVSREEEEGVGVSLLKKWPDWPVDDTLVRGSAGGKD